MFPIPIFFKYLKNEILKIVADDALAAMVRYIR